MTRESFQEIWKIIVEKGCNHYPDLTRPERIWFNLEPLTTGGLIDHYINLGAKYNSDTIEDLKYLNQHEIAELMIEFNSIFRNGVPTNIDIRNDEIGEFDEEFVDNIDERYWNLNDKLEKSLLSHICENFK